MFLFPWGKRCLMQLPKQTDLHTECLASISRSMPYKIHDFIQTQDLHPIPHYQQHFEYFQAGNENVEIKLCPHISQFISLSVLGKTNSLFVCQYLVAQARFRSRTHMPWIFLQVSKSILQFSVLPICIMSKFSWCFCIWYYQPHIHPSNRRFLWCFVH